MLQEHKLKTQFEPNVKFERFTRKGNGWGDTYSRKAKKPQRYEQNRKQKSSERYKDEDSDDQPLLFFPAFYIPDCLYVRQICRE